MTVYALTKCLCPCRVSLNPVPSWISTPASTPACLHSSLLFRRILRKIAWGQVDREGFGDITTLADPSVVDQLVATRGDAA